MEVKPVSLREMAVEQMRLLRRFVLLAFDRYEKGTATGAEIAALPAAAETLRLYVERRC